MNIIIIVTVSLWMQLSSGYFSGGSKANWTSAESFCQSQGTHLASVHSDDDWQEVTEICAAIGQSCWIGLRDAIGINNWEYADETDTNYAFNKYTQSDNEPCCRNDRCAQINMITSCDCAQLNDYNCSYDGSYPICNDLPDKSGPDTKADDVSRDGSGILITLIVLCVILVIFIALVWYLKNNDTCIQFIEKANAEIPLSLLKITSFSQGSIQETPQCNDIINEQLPYDPALVHWFTYILELPEYLDIFVLNGYDRYNALPLIKNKSELDMMGITKKGHQALIMSEIENLSKAINDLNASHEIQNKGKQRMSSDVSDDVPDTNIFDVGDVHRIQLQVPEPQKVELVVEEPEDAQVTIVNVVESENKITDEGVADNKVKVEVNESISDDDESVDSLFDTSSSTRDANGATPQHQARNTEVIEITTNTTRDNKTHRGDSAVQVAQDDKEVIKITSSSTATHDTNRMKITRDAMINDKIVLRVMSTPTAD